jgi:hypothetical protein
MVPALRQWLTRKQRESRRGRTELLLAERVALWSAKQESQQLPGWWEWSNILLFTRKKDWTAPQRQMLRAATRKHFFQASVLAVFLALIGWAFLAWQQGPLKASTLVRELASAETVRVPDIIKDLSSCRDWANPQLRKMLEDFQDSRKEHLHASLALLALFPRETEPQKDYLYNRLLETENLTEFLVINDALREYSPERLQQLWDLLENETDPERRFRIAGALAWYNPDNPQWAKYIDEVTKLLVTKDHVEWFQLVQPIRDGIANSLLRIVRDPTRPESERYQATRLYIHVMKISKGSLADRFELFLDLDGRQYDLFLTPIWSDLRVVTWVPKELAKPPAAPEASEKDKDQLARRQAHAAVFLLQFDQMDGRIAPSELGEAALHLAAVSAGF